MQLRRLTSLEREKIEQEYQELVARIGELKAILSDERKLMGVVRKSFGDPGALRGPSPDPDRPRPARAGARGPHRRRAGGGHLDPLWLCQAGSGRHLPGPAAGRPGDHRRPRPGRGLCGAALSSPRPTATSSSSPTGAGSTGCGPTKSLKEAGPPGERPWSTSVPGGGGAGDGHLGHRPVRRRPLPGHGHPPGDGEEDRALRVRHRPGTASSVSPWPRATSWWMSS